MDQMDFLKGALIGGCLGGVAALLLAPKSGKDLIHDISDSYGFMNTQSQEYASSLKSSIKNILDMLQKGGSDSRYAYLLGGAAGAVIGALAGLLIAPEAGNKLRARLGYNYDDIYEKAMDMIEGIKDKKNDLASDIEDKIEDWKDIFEKIVDKLGTVPRSKKPQGVHLNNILDWATLGLRCYNQMKVRR